MTHPTAQLEAMLDPMLVPLTEPDATPQLTLNLEPTLHDEPAHPTMADNAHTEHMDTIAPELSQPVDTPIPDPTHIEPNILYIFEDA